MSGDFLMRILLAGAMVFFMIWETHPRYSLHPLGVDVISHPGWEDIMAKVCF